MSFILVFSLSSKCQSQLTDGVHQLTKVTVIEKGSAKLSIKEGSKRNKHASYHSKKKKNTFLNEDIGESDILRQKSYGKALSGGSRSTLASFNGINSNSNPHDPSIAVGPNHVVQMCNGPGGGNVIIFDKTGTILVNQFTLSTLSSITGGGDGIVLYDQFADRWILTEFEPNDTGSDRLIIAISDAGDPDPANATYTIFSSITAPTFPDYPKYSIWDDHICITSNESGNDENGIYVIDKNALYGGNTTANFVRFDITDAGGLSGLFNPPSPVQVSGFTEPNSNPVFFQLEDDGWCNSCNDGINLYTVNVDWNNPANATLNGPTLIGLTAFDTSLCGLNSFNCIPQPNSNTFLDPVTQLLMNNPTYRSWNGNESIVATFSVDSDGNNLAGIRWFELRKSGTTWSVFQEGTFAPNDGLHRWMGSISINQNGDIGLLYNVSGSTLFPSIWYTGRVANDPTGVLSYPEQTLIAGSSSNVNNRYGDYNGLVIDPDGDVDFWGTGMYTGTGADARTRIGEFNILDLDGIYVDNNNNNTGIGTVDNPFNTFLLGINNACPDCSIFIHGGVYNESFPVVIDGIQLLLNSYDGIAILK